MSRERRHAGVKSDGAARQMGERAGGLTLSGSREEEPQEEEEAQSTKQGNGRQGRWVQTGGADVKLQGWTHKSGRETEGGWCGPRPGVGAGP